MTGATDCAVLAVTMLLAGSPAAGSSPPPAADRMIAVVEQLTAPVFAGRGAGAPPGAALADTLAAWLGAAGLTPAFAGSWDQAFPLTGTGWAGQDLAGCKGRNVAGVLAGAGDLVGRWILLAAHHDHLGRVAPAAAGAPPPVPGGYYPGANDNASGVAIVLETARFLAATGSGDRRGVLVVLFDGEEVGLQGARHLAAHMPVPLDSVDVVVNLDTVGRLQDGTLHVSGLGTSPPLAAAVAAAAGGDFQLRTGRGGWSGSDHMVFNTLEVPVLFLFGGAYPEYNRPADTAATLEPKTLVAVAAYAARLVDTLRLSHEDFPWVMVGDGGLREEGDEAGAGNRATWLGTLPDFTEDVTGYRLAGVFDDSPAQRAGLQKGDVLVRFAGAAVTDLATFTRALRAVDPGDLVEVEVERDGRILRFTVVMGDRSERK